MYMSRPYADTIFYLYEKNGTIMEGSLCEAIDIARYGFYFRDVTFYQLNLFSSVPKIAPVCTETNFIHIDLTNINHEAVRLWSLHKVLSAHVVKHAFLVC